MRKAQYMTSNEPRMWRGSDADQFHTLDLLQVEGSAHDQVRQINAQRRSFAGLCGNCLSQLFSGHACEMNLSPFTACEAPGTQEFLDQGLWLLAQGELPIQRQTPLVMMQIDPAVLYSLTILFFGGAVPNGSNREVPRRNPTDTEIRLLQRLLQHQADIMSPLLGWDEQSWQVATGSPDQLPEQGRWLLSRVSLQLGGFEAHWQLYWPLLSDEKQAPQQALAAALVQALPRVPVQLHVLMQEWNMNLADVSQLQVGDVLSLDLSAPLPACLGSQICLQGHIAEHQGNLVFQVVDV